MGSESNRRPGPREVAGRLFSGLALSYDRVLDWATLMQDRHWKRLALSKSSPSPGDLLLDVGCGTCVTEERGRLAGYQTVGLDITERMLRLGLRKRPRVIALVNGDAEALPFAGGKFDLVISFYAIKYCSTDRFVSEVSRVLRPGGRLVVYDFVRPRGKAGPVLSFYIYGVLKIAGNLFRPLDQGVSYTFGALPDIVRATTWNEELPAALRAWGLNITGTDRPSGGAVQIVYAVREGSRPPPT